MQQTNFFSFSFLKERKKNIFSTKIEKNGNFHKILSLANDVNNFMRPRGHEAENELMTEFFMEFVIAFFLVSQKMIAIEVIKLWFIKLIIEEGAEGDCAVNRHFLQGIFLKRKIRICKFKGGSMKFYSPHNNNFHKIIPSPRLYAYSINKYE